MQACVDGISVCSSQQTVQGLVGGLLLKPQAGLSWCVFRVWNIRWVVPSHVEMMA